MTRIRQIDHGVQVFIGLMMIITSWTIYIPGLLLLLTGAWQLISAACNTQAFVHHGMKPQIIKYWRCTAAVLGTIPLCLLLNTAFDPDDVQVLFWIAVAASVPLAIYYVCIYNKLIKVMKLKRELSGLTKSHH